MPQEYSSSALTYSEVARRVQGMLAERPVVILGTGTSIPHGLPSMSLLAEQLKQAGTSDLPGWRELAQALDGGQDLEQALHNVQMPRETMEFVIRTTWEIIAEKDLEFYDQLLEGHVAFPLADLFRHLLRTADARLSVVTTNYDRVAEFAANRVGAYVSTGMTVGWLQRFVARCVNSEHAPAPGYEGAVAVLKVHGSLDWFLDRADSVVGVPLARAIPKDTRPLIVTPGVSKYREVHKDPFRTVMSASDAVLRGARCYVCVGYGFNDEHVQPVLMQRVRKDDVALLVVAKSLTSQARRAFLDAPPKRFLMIEESGKGSMVYAPSAPEGIELAGVNIWQLGAFMGMVSGEKEA